METREELAKACDDFDGSRESFRTIVASALSLGFTEHYFSQAFGIGITSVRRWSEGHNVPATRVGRYVIRVIADTIRGDMKHVENKP